MNRRRDLKRKGVAIIRIQNLFAYQIRWQLINSNPSKCRRTLSNGTVVENCQVINKNITMLERKTKGKLPKVKEEIRGILLTESCSGLGDFVLMVLIRHQKRHKLYKHLWESHGILFSSRQQQANKICVHSNIIR